MKRSFAFGLAFAAVLLSLACSSSDSTSGSGGSAATGPGTGGSGGQGMPCTGGLVRCSGKCVDITTDTSNCGACGQECAADELCCGGVRVATMSCSFAVTGVTPDKDWQNGGGWVTITGAGFAAGMKVYIGDGRAPALVKNATTAILQTPPGSVGAHDIKIDLAGQTATLPSAFQYGAGDLLTQWQKVSMKTVRGEWPALAVMQDARVLIAGGAATPDQPDTSLIDAEIFTRKTTVVKPATGTMSAPRWRAGAVTLLDGDVLVLGAACWDDLTGCMGPTNAADLFDPVSEKFTLLSPLNYPRTDLRAVILADGRAILASGNDPSVEIYDPAKKNFTLKAPLGPHVAGAMVRLRDGRVLLAGGIGVMAAEVYDPEKDMFTPVGPLNKTRYYMTAHTLPDGRVLLIGGAEGDTGNWTPLDSIEIFDPVKGTFSLAPYKLTTAKYGLGSALVRDGTVIAIGGYTTPGKCDSLTDSVDTIDPVKNTVTPFSALPDKNTELNATTLLDGSIVAVGGGACGMSEALPFVYFLPSDAVPN